MEVWVSQSYDAGTLTVSSGYSTLSGEGATGTEAALAIREALFNLAVFSLDWCSEIQVIDTSVWYSPASCSSPQGQRQLRRCEWEEARCVISLPFPRARYSLGNSLVKLHHTQTASPSDFLHDQQIWASQTLAKQMEVVTKDILRLGSPYFPAIHLHKNASGLPSASIHPQCLPLKANTKSTFLQHMLMPGVVYIFLKKGFVFPSGLFWSLHLVVGE